MTYFGLSFWDRKDKKSLGATIVEGDDIHAAIAKLKSLNIFPLDEIENGAGMAIASEIPPDKLRYFPIEMFDAMITMEKLQESLSGLDPLNPDFEDQEKSEIAH